MTKHFEFPRGYSFLMGCPNPAPNEVAASLWYKHKWKKSVGEETRTLAQAVAEEISRWDDYIELRSGGVMRVVSMLPGRVSESGSVRLGPDEHHVVSVEFAEAVIAELRKITGEGHA